MANAWCLQPPSIQSHGVCISCLHVIVVVFVVHLFLTVGVRPVYLWLEKEFSPSGTIKSEVYIKEPTGESWWM